VDPTCPQVRPTPLQAACIGGHADVVAYLIERKVNLNQKREVSCDEVQRCSDVVLTARYHRFAGLCNARLASMRRASTRRWLRSIRKQRLCNASRCSILCAQECACRRVVWRSITRAFSENSMSPNCYLSARRSPRCSEACFGCNSFVLSDCGVFWVQLGVQPLIARDTVPALHFSGISLTGYRTETPFCI
jgi:hypothetical protein